MTIPYVIIRDRICKKGSYKRTTSTHRFHHHSIDTLSDNPYVIGSGKTGLIHTSTEIQFLSISERYTHALPRNTKHLAIDGQVCLYRWLFADAVKPQRCMSWSWGALIGLHGVPNCSSRQSGPPLWIVPVHVTY